MGVVVRQSGSAAHAVEVSMAKGPRAAAGRVGNGARHVLLAVDFSRRSNQAVDRVADLGLASRASVRMLHVLPRGLAGTDARYRVLAREELDRTADRLRRALAARHRGDVAVTTELVSGPGAETIVRAAGRDADVIVLGRRGRGVLRELLLGSTTRRVIRLSRVPVLAVAGPAPRSYRRIVVGLDASPVSVRALRMALELSDRARSRFVIVNAIEDPLAGLPRSMVPATAHERSAVRAQRLRERTRHLREVVDRMIDRPGAWRLVVRAADPRRAILDAATAGPGADLIAVGTTSRGGLPARLIGSVAEAVLERARTDVLVVPPA